MTVELAWLLGQRELGLRLVDGPVESGPITWAHSVDIPDPTPWLTGGELVLTTGLRLDKSVAEQRAYVERLVAAGATGLGFGVGVRFDAVPAGLVKACAEQGLPLVEVPLTTPFIAVIKAVLRRLSEDEVDSLQEALNYQRAITRAAIKGGLPGVVVVISRELGCDAVVLDEYGAVIASSTRDKRLLDHLHAEWTRLHRPRPRAGARGVPTEKGTLEIQTLQGRSAVVGWLALHLTAAVSPTQRLLLNQAAGLVTVHLDWPAEFIATYHAVGGTLLRLLLDPAQDAALLVPQLKHFGFKPADEVTLVLVSAPRAHRRIERILTERLEAQSRPHVVALVDGGVAALVLTRDAGQLVPVLDEALHGSGLSKVALGVSGPVSQTEAASAFGPAAQAAATARRERRRVWWFEDLTLGSILSDETVRARIWAQAGPALHVLEQRRGSRESELISTLETYLHHNGSWETASRALGVHRHTLRARIARVEELTGLDLNDAECRVLLLLALMSRPRSAVAAHQQR